MMLNATTKCVEIISNQKNQIKHGIMMYLSDDILRDLGRIQVSDQTQYFFSNMTIFINQIKFERFSYSNMMLHVYFLEIFDIY